MPPDVAAPTHLPSWSPALQGPGTGTSISTRTSTSTSTSKPGRFNKACDSCHVSKVRCMPDPQSPVASCKRCSKNATSCVFSPVGPRKRPVRTKNDRIAELERRVRDMQLKLERQVEKRAGGPASGPAHDAPDPSPDPASPVETEPWPWPRPRPRPVSGPGPHLGPASESSSRPSALAAPMSADAVDARTTGGDVCSSVSLGEHDPEGAAPEPPHPAGAEELDIIERGLLTSSQADRLIHEFRSNLDGKFLGMRLPDGLSGARLRREKPAFWLSVLCAASTGSADLLSLAPMLFGEMKRVLDGRITSGAAPDLDALQALMNYTTFHYDPVLPLGKHMLGVWGAAIRMVVQMAQASPLHALPPPSAEEDSDVVARLVADDDVQLARELLHWYWASFSLTIKNRQSTMLHQTHLVEASVRVLQTTQSHHDMCLVEWVRLVRIAAEAVLALHRGHTEESAGLSDEARDGILDEFERKRKRWLVECPFDFVNEPLMLEYHYYVLLVSEVIYPAGPADFRCRSYGLPSLSLSLSLSLKTSTPLPDQHFFAPYKLRYTRKCITAAHACLDLAIRASDAESGSYRSDKCSTGDLLRRFGVLPHGRIFYALRFLLFVAHEVWRTGRYDVVDVEGLRVEAYLTDLKRCLRAASSGGKYRVSSLWLYALETRIEPWYRRLYTLLQRDGPRTAQREGAEGRESARPPSRRTASPNRRVAASESQGRDSNTVNALAEVSLSPRLLEFPFEDFSASDMFAAPASNVLPHFSWGLSTNPTTSASTLNGEAQLATTATSTRTSSEPLREPATGSLHLERPLEISPDIHSGANDSQDRYAGDLDTWFGNLNMDLDPFTFNWDYLSEVLPGSDTFPSSVPPGISAEAAQKTDCGGAGDKGGVVASAQSGP